MWEASWALVVKVLPRVSARNTAVVGTPDAGHGWSGPGKRGWATRQGPGTVGDIGPLGVQGDELAGQVGQDRPGGISACHRHGLFVQGIADMLGPGGMAAGSVLVQPGIDACLAGLLVQRGGGGGGPLWPPRWRRAPRGIPGRPRGRGGVWVYKPRIRLETWLT